MSRWLIGLIYGAVYGFSRFTPISASAHQALSPLLLNFDGGEPLLSLFVHGGALGALILLYRQRIAHLHAQVQLLRLPPRKRKRPPDPDAVVDIRLIMTAAVAILPGAVASAFTARWQIGLLPLSLLLIAMATFVFIPDYRPGGRRRTRSMTPLEGILLGVLASVSVIPGLSAVGLMLGFAQLRKCDRSTLPDVVLLIDGVMLCAMMAVDIVRIPFSGFSGFSAGYLLQCVAACIGAFCGGLGAIQTMRFLSVKRGFSDFAYYGWGLGAFVFILYLAV